MFSRVSLCERNRQKSKAMKTICFYPSFFAEASPYNIPAANTALQRPAETSGLSAFTAAVTQRDEFLLFPDSWSVDDDPRVSSFFSHAVSPTTGVSNQEVTWLSPMDSAPSTFISHDFATVWNTTYLNMKLKTLWRRTFFHAKCKRTG